MKDFFKVYGLFVIVLIFSLLISASGARCSWEHFTPNNISELPFSQITALAVDLNSLWIGTDNGLVEKKLSLDSPNEGWIVHSEIDPNYVPISLFILIRKWFCGLGLRRG